METREVIKVLAVKLDFPRNEEGRALYRRIRDLSWQAMQYGNNFLRAMWAERAGLRVKPEAEDPHDLTKHIRKHEKGELSGAAYSAIEREAAGLWQRHGKRILAGAPLPEFREGKALSIRGHKHSQAESGVRLTFESGQFYAHLQAQAGACDGGSWLTIPIAKNTATDDYQAPLLHQMAAWEIPIRKATISLMKERGSAVLRLTYGMPVQLPEMGSRAATLGPLTKHGDRLLLRTELETKDYSSRLARIMAMKKSWDHVRRRALCQIGRRKGSARIKRKVLARMTWEKWLDTYLHQWSFELVDWCASQGVGQITILNIQNGDWPAFAFEQKVSYKAASRNITVVKESEASLDDAATARAAKQEVARQKKRAKKLGDAVREITSQIA